MTDDPAPQRAALPDRLVLEAPAPFLTSISIPPPLLFDLDATEVAQMFALAGIAAVARRNDRRYLVKKVGTSGAARFAHAIGFDEAVEGRAPHSPGTPGRTVKLRRVLRYEELEAAASEISHLILPEDEEGRLTVYYVLVELLRNVVQHSRDPLGAVVAAQRMDEQQHYDRAAIQVCVADCGIGILDAMRGLHPELNEAGEALEKAIRPHMSGTFEEGLTGSQQNAGMGLFFISEMAKLTAGRLLLATRGNGLLLQGDLKGEGKHDVRLLGPPGFPGTLVAFELPLGEVKDFNALIATIAERARARTPQRALHHWLKFDNPSGLVTFLVSRTAENTLTAQRFASEELERRILKKESFVLDFRGIQVATQSYLHALLFETLRLAWARRVPIYVVNAAPAIKSGLDLLESYALGG